MGAVIRPLVVILAFLAMITANVLANVLPINGVTTGEVSYRYDVLFQPAAYVFAIWGVIYFGLGAYVIYQALPTQRDDARVRRLDGPFVLSCVANIAWLLLWHYGYIVASMFAMLALLGSLATIYVAIDPERTTAPIARRWAVHHPFSLYLAWISIATLANVAITIEHLGRSESAVLDLVGYIIAALTALTAAGLVALPRADVAWVLTGIWAFVGLALVHVGEPVPAAVAWVGVAALLAMLVIAVVRRLQQNR